jgi:hypothetical protein
MSKHLNADQMTEWTAGERRPELERHLEECIECRLAAEELQTALWGWREAVRGWSNQEYRVAEQRTAVRAVTGRRNALSLWAGRGFYWATGATVMCALAALLVWYSEAVRVTQRYVAPSTLADSTIADVGHPTDMPHGANPDAVLMRQVDREVSQTVPDAMEPLMGLVSWDGAGAANEDTTGNKQSSKRVE